MTHKSNKQHLPPVKSDKEYEAEIARLKQVIEYLEGCLKEAEEDYADLDIYYRGK